MKAFPKGQLGFDFMFALVALLLLIQFLIAFSSEMTLQQNKINVRNQEEAVALKVKSVFNACHIADMGPGDGDTVVSARLPFIHAIDGDEDCEVSVAADEVTVSYTLGKGKEATDIIVTQDLPEAGGETLTAACGGEIIVTC